MKRVIALCAVLAVVPGLAFAADTGSNTPVAQTGAKAAVTADVKVDSAKKPDAVKSDAVVKTENATAVKTDGDHASAPAKTNVGAKAKAAHHKGTHKAAVTKEKPADTSGGKTEAPKL